jgi:hypothetical protein
MCGECRPSSSAARRCACIPKTLDMPLKVTDKTDKSPCRRHGFSSEHASDVLTKPTEGFSWFLPSLGGPRGPREQPRIHTEFVALVGRPASRGQAGPVFGLPAQAGRLRGAPRWAVGERTPPLRTGLRLRRSGGAGRRLCAFGPTWWWAGRGRRADLPRLGTCTPSSSTLWVGRRVAADGSLDGGWRRPQCFPSAEEVTRGNEHED